MASGIMGRGMISPVRSVATPLVSSLTLLLLLLAGCMTVGPDYVPPEVSASADWTAELEGGLTAEQIDAQTLAHWWTTLNDPILSSLIERAVAGNLDVKEARARVREARARRGLEPLAVDVVAQQSVHPAHVSRSHALVNPSGWT